MTPPNMKWITIISYQEIIGNYSTDTMLLVKLSIISYQEIIGNYSVLSTHPAFVFIISYQEIIGNYSRGKSQTI